MFFNNIWKTNIFFQLFFFGNSLFYPLFLRLVILCFILSFFSLNVLFFTEKYIIKRNNPNLKLNFLYMKLKMCLWIYNNSFCKLIYYFYSINIINLIWNNKWKRLFYNEGEIKKLDWNYSKKLKLLLLIVILVDDLIIWFC